MNTHDENPSSDAFALSDLWKKSIFTVASESPPVEALDDLGIVTFPEPYIIC